MAYNNPFGGNANFPGQQIQSMNYDPNINYNPNYSTGYLMDLEPPRYTFAGKDPYTPTLPDKLGVRHPTEFEQKYNLCFDPSNNLLNTYEMLLRINKYDFDTNEEYELACRTYFGPYWKSWLNNAKEMQRQREQEEKQQQFMSRQTQQVQSTIPPELKTEPIKEKKSEPLVDVEGLRKYYETMHSKGESNKYIKEIEEYANKINEIASKMGQHTVSQIDITNKIFKASKEDLEKNTLNINYPVVNGNVGAVPNISKFTLESYGITVPNYTLPNPILVGAMNFGMDHKLYEMQMYSTTDVPVVYAIDSGNRILKSKSSQTLARDMLNFFPMDFIPEFRSRLNSSNATQGLYVVERFIIHRHPGQTDEQFKTEINYFKRKTYGKAGNKLHVETIEKEALKPENRGKAYELTFTTFIHSSKLQQNPTIYVPELDMVLTTILQDDIRHPHSREYKDQIKTYTDTDLTVVTMAAVNNSGDNQKSYYVNLGSNQKPIKVKSIVDPGRDDGMYGVIADGQGTRSFIIPKQQFEDMKIYNNLEEAQTNGYDDKLNKRLQYEINQSQLHIKNLELEKDKLKLALDKQELEYKRERAEIEREKTKLELQIKEVNKETEVFKANAQVEQHQRTLEQNTAKFNQDMAMREVDYTMKKMDARQIIEKYKMERIMSMQKHRFDMEHMDRKHRIELDREKIKYVNERDKWRHEMRERRYKDRSTRLSNILDFVAGGKLNGILKGVLNK